MNKITSYTQLPTYETSKRFLNIYWNEQYHDDDTEPYWTYSVCRCTHDMSYKDRILALKRAGAGDKTKELAEGI